jgi:hypothetical protein
MDTPSLITITSASSVAVTILLYTAYRLCRRFHLHSQCCGQDTSIDFDTNTPPSPTEKEKKKEKKLGLFRGCRFTMRVGVRNNERKIGVEEGCKDGVG